MNHPEAPPRLIFLTGAPTTASLDWTEASLNDVWPPFEAKHAGSREKAANGAPDQATAAPSGIITSRQGLLHAQDGLSSSNEAALPGRLASPSSPLQTGAFSTSEHHPPAWREIPLVPGALHTGDTQPTPHLQFLGAEWASSPMQEAESPADEEANHARSQSQHFAALPAPGSSAEGPISTINNGVSVSYHEHLVPPVSLPQVPRSLIYPEASVPFVTHSLGLYDTQPSSQIILTEALLPNSESFASTSTTSSNAGPPPPCPPLTRLADLPSAASLDALRPQTLTVNLLVGITAAAPVVPIRPARLAGASLDLREITVGEAGAPGFRLSLWLGPSEDPKPSKANPGRMRDNPEPSDGRKGQASTRSPAERALRDTALGLERGDVVLVRNVALATWRGAVYGQSLRGGRTAIALMYSSVGRGAYSMRSLRNKGNGDALKARVRAVVDWLDDVVPSASGRKPPPDSQQD